MGLTQRQKEKLIADFADKELYESLLAMLDDIMNGYAVKFRAVPKYDFFAESLELTNAKAACMAIEHIKAQLAQLYKLASENA